MNKLEQAARQLLDYWDLEDSGEAADRYMADLREALAEPDIEEMTLTQIAARHEQAEQEPVAYAVKSQGSVFSLVSSVSVAEEIVSMLRNDCPDTTFFALYAAPVHTKDLTDDEIEEIGKSYFDEWSFGFARAVIAADREKNK